MLLAMGDIRAALAGLPGWQLVERGGAPALARDFLFPDFAAAFAFMTRVAAAAEAQGHHPDWRNSWNRVSITLQTHDEGGVTVRDLALARAIDDALPGP